MENTEREDGNGSERQPPRRKENTLVFEQLFGAVKMEIHRFETLTGSPSFLKAKIARIFTNDEGKWKETSYFGNRDLENVAKATAAANNYLIAHAPESPQT